MIWPSVTSCARPRPATMRISVVMIGCMPAPATRKPFHAPSSEQSARVTPAAASTPPAEFWSGRSLIRRHASAPAIATTEPTDRSMPPVAMTRVMPSATRIRGAPNLAMSTRLPYRWPSLIWTDRKPSVKARLSSSSATRTTTGHSSRCRSRVVMRGLRSRWSPSAPRWSGSRRWKAPPPAGGRAARRPGG